MSNEQIQQRIQSEKDLQNPLKGNFIEKMKAKILGPAMVGLQARMLGMDDKEARRASAKDIEWRGMPEEDKASLRERALTDSNAADQLREFQEAAKITGKVTSNASRQKWDSALGMQLGAVQSQTPGLNQQINDQNI